jgi:TPR repeat protein/uncharacterized membrane protein
MKICSNCSAQNEDGQKFCIQCGWGLVSDLEKLLVGAGLGRLLPIFEANDIRSLEVLKSLASDDLKDLQATGGTRIAYGDLIKLRKALEVSDRPPVVQVQQEPVSRLELLQGKASRGDLAAMHELGGIYAEGSEGVEEDPAMAASWYRKAAEKGHPSSQYKYGEALYFGTGVEENECQSAKWLRLASRQGHEEAKESYNDRVEERRLAYLLDSAEQGNGDSQFNLATVFYQGDQGQPVDKAQAAVWLRKAAAQGLGVAQCLLGAMHLQGDGIRQDRVEARRLLEAASAQGVTEATQLISSMEAPPVSEHPAAVAQAADFRAIHKVETVYLMMALSVVTCGITSIVAVIMAYMNRGKVPEGYLKTHYRWQIRSFWFYMLWGMVCSIATSIINPEKPNEGMIVGGLALLWYYYRYFRGKALLRKEKPAYKSMPPKVMVPVIIMIIVTLVSAGVIKVRNAEGKKKISLAQAEWASRQPADWEQKQRQFQAQQQSEKETRLTREKAEAEEKARRAQEAAEQAEREKQEALRKAQNAEQSAQAAQTAQAAAQAASQSSRPVSSPGFLGLNVSNGEGHQVNGVKTLIKGAFVTGVLRGSPAERAGIRKDDLVVSIGGVTVTGAQEMTDQIQRHGVGEVVTIGLVHGNGSTETVSAQLVSQSELSSATVDDRSAPQNAAPQSPGQQQLPDGFSDFFKQYIRNHGSNNAWDIAYDYADPCFYSYANGNASRAYICEDARKLIQAYPQRSYTDVGIENITVVSPDQVRLRFHFNYQYSGKKLARGTSTVDLEVRNFSGKWQITNFSEQVVRR